MVKKIVLFFLVLSLLISCQKREVEVTHLPAPLGVEVKQIDPLLKEDLPLKTGVPFVIEWQIFYTEENNSPLLIAPPLSTPLSEEAGDLQLTLWENPEMGIYRAHWRATLKGEYTITPPKWDKIPPLPESSYTIESSLIEGEDKIIVRGEPYTLLQQSTFLIVVGIVVVFFIILFIFMGRKRKKENEEPLIELPTEEEILAGLVALQSEENKKEFYEKLTFYTRSFLEINYEIEAFKLTAKETRRQLRRKKQTNLKAYSQKIGEILHRGDLVRFGKQNVSSKKSQEELLFFQGFIAMEQQRRALRGGLPE